MGTDHRRVVQAVRALQGAGRAVHARAERGDLRLYRKESTEIQTESNVIYLADVRYWNRDIELYVQFVAA